MNRHWKSLRTQLHEISLLNGVYALLNWDQETYMPKGAIQARSDQTALLATLIHKLHTSKEFEKSLGHFISLISGEITQNLEPQEKKLVELAYRDWKMTTCFPSSFIEEFSKLKCEAQFAWEEAKKEDSYKIYAPYLEKMISMCKKEADYLGSGLSPYDALLDKYEPNLKSKEIFPLFSRLRAEVVGIVQKINRCVPPQFVNLRSKIFDEDKQWKFGLDILHEMQFDLERGRLDKSVHPFTTDFHPTDVRITTRINPHDVMEHLASAMHEAGHALYEQGLDTHWVGTPLCQATSLGIHESQSRLWENYIGKNEAFWRGHFPKLYEYFPTQLSRVDWQDFYRTINTVQPSLIRVDADEVTYNLHIMIRFEIEHDIFENKIKVKDLPEIWNEKYKDYLNIKPKTYREGILQDIHWSGGAFGYFPTYTLGNLYACHFYNQLKKNIPHFSQMISSGNFKGIRQWLKTHIHSVGRKKSAQEILKDTTGETLSELPFIQYLKEKFGTIYQIHL